MFTLRDVVNLSSNEATPHKYSRILHLKENVTFEELTELLLMVLPECANTHKTKTKKLASKYSQGSLEDKFRSLTV